MPLETLPFDAAEHLTDPLDQAELVAEAFATGDAAIIRGALNLVARARTMSRAAADDGVAGEEEVLFPDSDPKLSTVLSILGTLGVRLSATLEPTGTSPPR